MMQSFAGQRRASNVSRRIKLYAMTTSCEQQLLYIFGRRTEYHGTKCVDDKIAVFVSESENGCFFEWVFLDRAERGAAASGEVQNDHTR